MKSTRNVISEDNATPDRDLNQQLPELEDFFFWLCFWLADLLEPAGLTALIVSSFSAVTPDFFDLDFLFAFFLPASLPLGFEPCRELGLPSPSAPMPALAICRLFSSRSWAARRSLSRYSDLKFTQTLTCKTTVKVERSLDSFRLGTQHSSTRVGPFGYSWLTVFLAACWQSFSVEQRPTIFSQAGVKGFPFKSK